MFVIWHRKPVSSFSDSSGVRIVISYWLGWEAFCFIILWNLINIEMGYSEWHKISNGLAGPRSWDKLHLSEILAVFGIAAVLWLAAGREVVTLDSGQLEIRKGVLGLGWSSRYPTTDVAWLHAGWFLDPKARGKWNSDHVRAALYFGCRGKTRSFGNELTMEDAVRIEKLLRAFVSAPSSR